MKQNEQQWDEELTDRIDEASELIVGHRNWEFIHVNNHQIGVRFLKDEVMLCDLCESDTEVGYVDEANTFKVCEHCDVDGQDFTPKNWPVKVLNEVGLDRDGYLIPDHDEARMLDETHTDIREVLG